MNGSIAFEVKLVLSMQSENEGFVTTVQTNTWMKALEGHLFLCGGESVKFVRDFEKTFKNIVSV